MPNPLDEFAKALKGVDAPYNFVPLNGSVFRDKQAYRVSQDIPFSDGISGRLLIELETITPTCVGNEQKDSRVNGLDDRKGPSQVHPLQLVDGRLAISGASLRGAIRSVLEIASFSRMQRYDNPAMSLRDLAGPISEIYRKKLVDDDKGFVYKGHAGWLEKTAKGWHVRKCRMSRVSHADLHEYSEKKWKGFENLRTKEGKFLGAKRAKDKYKEWVNACGHLNIGFDSVDKVEEKSNIQGSFVTRLGQDLHTNGTLVFTGQPGGYKTEQLGQTSRKKCREFIFHSEGDTLELDKKVLADFFQVHKDSEDLEFLRGDWFQRQIKSSRQSEVELRLPVFFLEDESATGHVESLGLALMYRIPYQHDFQHAVGNSSQDHHGNDFDDLGSLLFGGIDGQGKTALKGRVQFGLLKSEGSEVALEAHRVVLNGPKPSFYPAYLEQPGQDKGILPRKSYNTLQQDNVKIRGRKRYPTRPGHQARASGNDKLDTVLHCIPAGVRLTGSVRFHNLRPFELGALIWSLTFGRRENCVHNIGTGKPYGLGQIRISLHGIEGRSLADETFEPECLIKAFVDCMEDCAKLASTGELNEGWFNSAVTQNLLAMADPASAARWEQQTECNLRYLRPEGPGFGDKGMPQLHQKIKNWCRVLPSYANQLPDVLGQVIDPEIEKWVDDHIIEIADANNASEEEALRGKQLLARVQAIGDQKRQLVICECIKVKWGAKGFWDVPPGKAARKAKLGYQEILGEAD